MTSVRGARRHNRDVSSVLHSVTLNDNGTVVAQVQHTHVRDDIVLETVLEQVCQTSCPQGICGPVNVTLM